MKQSLAMAGVIALLLTSTASIAQYRKIDSLMNALRKSAGQQRVDIQNRLSSEYLTLNIDSANRFAMLAYSTSSEQQYGRGQFFALENLMRIHTSKGNLRKVLQIDREAEEVAEKIGDEELLAVAKSRSAITFIQSHNERRGFEKLIEARQTFEARGSKDKLSNLYISLGNVYALRDNHKVARKYYAQAVDYSNNSPQTTNVVNINVADILQKERRYRESIELLNTALSYFEARRNGAAIAFILQLKAAAFYKLGDNANAAQLYRSALDIYESIGNSIQASACLIFLGKLADESGQHVLAKTFFDRAMQKQTSDHHQLNEIHSGLARYYENQNQYPQALRHINLAQLHRDSVLSREERAKLDELRIKYEVEENEKAIEMLTMQSFYGAIIIILLLLLALTGAFRALKITRRQRHTIMQAEQGVKTLEQALEEKSESERQLKESIEVKLKELTGFTLNMIQKKEMLENLKVEIEAIREKSDGELRNQLSRVLSTISFSQHLDKGWDNFKLYFEQVNQGFFDNLQEMFPDLNANDLKLCALIKLNLDTKQIASVMDISPESAKVAKHRIRKKLGLTGSDNLTSFFASVARGVKFQQVGSAA